MPLHDANYQHWDGVHLGLWHRRWVITQNGLRACLQNQMARQLVVLSWLAALAVSALLFFVGQLLVVNSVVAPVIQNLNPQLQTFARMLTSWLEQRPEISVHVAQNVLFYYFCINLMRLSIFALGIVIPLLITRDLASNAITIYSSKAVSKGDYLLGKFATAFGLLTMTWLGPVCAAWLLGNLLAPDWHFFWHSRFALAHILAYGLSSMAILSALALGISATSSKMTTGAFWMIWWIFGGILTPIALQTKPWLRHLSFSFNLDQIALAVFHVGDDLKVAQDQIPILGDMLRQISAKTIASLSASEINGALLALLTMLCLAAAVLHTRVKPE